MDDKGPVMLVHSFKNQFAAVLHGMYPSEEINSFFSLLVEHKLKMSRVELALKPNLEFDRSDELFFNEALNDLKRYKPIQYIIGQTTFYNLQFKVNEHVLIPRPETEQLVEWIIQKHHNSKDLKILDIGSGSGCIAIALAKNMPDAEITALDISNEAVKVVFENSKLNNVDIQCINTDILSTTTLPQCYDIIVSNPPYVREMEKEQMRQNVLEFEPHVALFVKNDNPLQFYEKIADMATKYLHKKGSLFFEINESLGSKTMNLLASRGFKNIELKKDFLEVDRMISANL